MLFLLFTFFDVLFQPVKPAHGLNDYLLLSNLTLRRFVILPFAKLDFINKIELVHASEHCLNEAFSSDLGESNIVAESLDGKQNFHHAGKVLFS
jgi:hypothetical protein